MNKHKYCLLAKPTTNDERQFHVKSVMVESTVPKARINGGVHKKTEQI